MIAYCGGTFDMFHPGHVALLKWAKESFGGVVVALNTDEFVEQYKGRRPIMNYEERAYVLRACRYVDLVVKNIGGRNSRISIEIVQPDVIVNGADWTREKLLKQKGIDELFLEQTGIKIAIFPNSLAIHTTDIRERLKS